MIKADHQLTARDKGAGQGGEEETTWGLGDMDLTQGDRLLPESGQGKGADR